VRVRGHGHEPVVVYDVQQIPAVVHDGCVVGVLFEPSLAKAVNQCEAIALYALARYLLGVDSDPGSVFEPGALPEHRLHGGIVCPLCLHFDVRRWGELAFARAGGPIEEGFLVIGVGSLVAEVIGHYGVEVVLGKALWEEDAIGITGFRRVFANQELSREIRVVDQGFSDFGIEHPNDFLVRQDAGQAFNMPRKEDAELLAAD